MRYLRSGWLLLDIVSVFPFDLVAVFANLENVPKAALRLPRTMLLLRLIKLVRRSERTTERAGNEGDAPSADTRRARRAAGGQWLWPGRFAPGAGAARVGDSRSVVGSR